MMDAVDAGSTFWGGKKRAELTWKACHGQGQPLVVDWGGLTPHWMLDTAFNPMRRHAAALQVVKLDISDS